MPHLKPPPTQKKAPKATKPGKTTNRGKNWTSSEIESNKIKTYRFMLNNLLI